ncbi:uncharacterized protein LOC123220243 [Mangifera indica]|uniref:uncharacterized protein LOC123220243 n=1 Tax=Mangifera indica TaxID=29780 RepID=UPI001CFBA758|nr:uncharacterized protein LOC123220243 [Mangifera indica]XP_044498265.1 uncharacterized protein LOC123220243 [Mangifera indica]
MASLAANFTAFLFLFPAGLNRLLFSSSLYLKNPSVFRSKPWYFSDQRYKNFDLYFLIISLPIASFSELFFFLTFSGHPTFRFSFFMQSASLFLFWLLIIIIFFRETYDAFIVNESFAFLFLGISFLVEYSVVGKGIGGPLGGEAYNLLGELTLICAGACLVLSIKPTAFFAEFFLSCGLIFKGTWLLQTGFSLYTDTFAFKGCHKISPSTAKDFIESKCDLDKDGLRGVAFINLLFVAHAIAVFIGSVVLFGFLSSHKKLGRGEASGPLLAQLESDSSLMHPVPEFELE